MTQSNEMPDEYYIRNKDAGFLGNAPVWYAKNGNGYTAYILGAERFSEQEAMKIVSDDTDKYEAFKCSDVDARLHLVFDMQDKRRLGTDEKCPWKFGYAEPRVTPAQSPNRAVLDALKDLQQKTIALIEHFNCKGDIVTNFEPCMKRVNEAIAAANQADEVKVIPVIEKAISTLEGYNLNGFHSKLIADLREHLKRQKGR